MLRQPEGYLFVGLERPGTEHKLRGIFMRISPVWRLLPRFLYFFLWQTSLITDMIAEKSEGQVYWMLKLFV